MHRKGATRALPAGHEDNPHCYMDIGHPAIIPGSMGTGSYVVLGTDDIQRTFCSVNHGAGRVMSENGQDQNLLGRSTGSNETCGDYCKKYEVFTG